MRSYYYLVLLFITYCTGTTPPLPRLHRAPFTLSRLRRATEQDFWATPSVNFQPGQPILDIPVNNLPTPSDRDLDKIQVVSSALRILPKNDRLRGKRETVSNEADDLKQNSRRKRETVQSWRKPRQHQFVTNKLDRLPPPPIVRVYPPLDRNERVFDRALRKGQRRIIYYADLPEIVRPPVQWYNTRREYFDTPRQAYPSASTFSSTVYPSGSPSSFSPSSFLSPNDNEITRVQSNIIDVTNSPRYNGYSPTPKFTIIDVDPVNYPSYYRRPPARYEVYPSQRFNPNMFYNDIRTPPYRDYSNFPPQNFRPEPSLEPVKLQIPTTDRPTTINSTNIPANTTRFLPDTIPVSLRSLSKFVT